MTRGVVRRERSILAAWVLAGMAWGCSFDASRTYDQGDAGPETADDVPDIVSVRGDAAGPSDASLADASRPLAEGGTGVDSAAARDGFGAEVLASDARADVVDGMSAEDGSVDAPIDAAAESAPDVSVDAPIDVAAESAPDVFVDAPMDVAAESAPDVSVDAPMDVAADVLESACSSAVREAQRFSATMAGCLGSVGYSQRATLCRSGCSVCTADQWIAGRGGRAPSHHYWVEQRLGRRGDAPNACWASPQGEWTDPCRGNAPMHVCSSAQRPGEVASDPLGNLCEWNGCGYRSGGSEYFGGCGTGSGHQTAGTLCCCPP